MNINEIIQAWSAALAEATHGNEMIAGAITLWAIGILTYIARGVPLSVYSYIKRQSITTLTLNNAGWYEADTMFNFLKWVQPKMNDKLSRTLSVYSSQEKEADLVGIGYGIHFFFIKYRLFWMNRSQLDSSGSERQKDQVSISTFGRSHQPLKDIVTAFAPKKDDTVLKVYRLDMYGEWISYAKSRKRPMGSVALAKTLKDSMIEKIQHFKDNRDWYYNKGLPHKVTFLVHGQPGTGKTSLIKALASHFNMNIGIININAVSDKLLESGLASTPKNSMIIIEDFDSAVATRDRSIPKETEEYTSLTLTGLLNTLDGAIPLDDCVVFLTTNHLDQIDPAIYRKGRVDHLVAIDSVNSEDVREYVQYLFPEQNLDNTAFGSTLGCRLNEALLRGRDNFEEFMDCLNEF